MRTELDAPPTAKSVFRFVLICSVGFSITPLVNSIKQPEYNKDYSLWHGIGIEVRNDRPLYSAGKNGEVYYMYPPTAAVLLFAPISLLGHFGFVLVYVLSTGLAWAGCLYYSIRLATGRWTGHPRWYYALGLVVIGPYVYDLFLLGQVNLVLLLLVLVAMERLQLRRPWTAGLCLGLAIAIKVFPLPILVYWAARREWRAIVATVLAIGLFVFVLPGAVRGFERNVEEERQWANLMIGDQSGNTMAARSSVGFTRRNQSLLSLAHRLTRDVEAGDPGQGFKVNFVDLSPRAAQFIGVSAVAFLGCILLIATRCRFAPTPAAQAQEVAMVCILAVLCSPLAWTYFFCWLLPAWAVVLHGCRTHRWAIVPTIVSGFLLLSAFTEQFDPILQAYGVTVWGSVGLYLAIAALRWNESGRS